nr:dual specificity protein phosphatase 22 isoform X5 [Drosophila kikkawai]
MNWHMGQVLPGLYVGNYRDSKDHTQLERFKISHIIAIHDSPRRLLPDKHYLCVMASDTPDQNLSQYFSVCNDFIHAARLREGNVLIHCLAGMSRSVTVAVAYIMTATHLNWKEALKVVRAGRAVANPNTGFQNQLQEFEQFKLSEERRRLRERFPSSALEQLDRTKVATALDNYQELLQNRDICEGNCSRGEKCPTGAHMVFVRNGEGEDEGKEDPLGSVKRSVAYTLSFAAEKWKDNTFNSASRDLHDPLSSSSGEDLMANVRYYEGSSKNKGRFVNNIDSEEMSSGFFCNPPPSPRSAQRLKKRRQPKSSPKKA